MKTNDPVIYDPTKKGREDEYGYKRPILRERRRTILQKNTVANKPSACTSDQRQNKYADEIVASPHRGDDSRHREQDDRHQVKAQWELDLFLLQIFPKCF